MAGFVIPLETKINFLEFIVVPSFGRPCDDLKTREEWMRETAGERYGENLEILLILYNTIQTLAEAESELAAYEAKSEREREFLLQQHAGTFDLSLVSSPCLIPLFLKWETNSLPSRKKSLPRSCRRLGLSN
jgi:hypothetical protein